MLLKNVDMLVSNLATSSFQGNTYYRAGLMTLDGDGQLFSASIKTKEEFESLKPLMIGTFNLDLTSGKNGIKMTIDKILKQGSSIVSGEVN